MTAWPFLCCDNGDLYCEIFLWRVVCVRACVCVCICSGFCGWMDFRGSFFLLLILPISQINQSNRHTFVRYIHLQSAQQEKCLSARYPPPHPSFMFYNYGFRFINRRTISACGGHRQLSDAPFPRKMGTWAAQLQKRKKLASFTTATNSAKAQRAETGR